jgi:hypothetical protein
MDKFNDLPLFRSTDPEGSSNGARHIKPRQGSQAMTLLRVYTGHSVYGLTDEEAAQLAGVHHGWKRCADLRRLGYIEPTGAQRPTMAGVNAMVCRITQAGYEALRP